MDFSLVIPTCKCSQTLVELSERLVSTLSVLLSNFEIIFVNGNSLENDWEIVA